MTVAFLHHISPPPLQTPTGVIVIGATNKRDNLDKALIRPGRFDVEVTVYPPDLKSRKELFDLYVSRVLCDQGIVGQNSHKSGGEYWVTRSSVRSFTLTVRSFAGSTLLASLARSTVLIRLLGPELEGKCMIQCLKTT